MKDNNEIDSPEFLDTLITYSVGREVYFSTDPEPHEIKKGMLSAIYKGTIKRVLLFRDKVLFTVECEASTELYQELSEEQLYISYEDLIRDIVLITVPTITPLSGVMDEELKKTL